LSSIGSAEEPKLTAEVGEEGEKLISGMSIVGNDEAPKSLVIVPWKSSLLAETLDVSRGLGGGREPVDRDVFMRELDYYEIRAGAHGPAGPERPLSGGPGIGRADEEIQIVFDRHKAALYRLYNRALRRDPTLKGQVVLRMTIETDGSVSLSEVQSSDMDAPKLSSQIAARVKGFDFGAKEGVPAITILYPIDFLPAT